MPLVLEDSLGGRAQGALRRRRRFSDFNQGQPICYLVSHPQLSVDNLQRIGNAVGRPKQPAYCSAHAQTPSLGLVPYQDNGHGLF